jgi:BASS family bile acid:Na+ symporter
MQPPPLVVLTVFPSLLAIDSELENLIVKQALQLVLLLLFPVVLGMMLRHWKPVLTRKMMPVFEKIGAVGLFDCGQCFSKQ